MSLDAIRVGKRTKTALSNSALNCTPLTAFAHVYLAKSSGDLLELQPGECIARFKGHASAEKLAPDQLAEVACLSPTANRRPPLSRHRSDRDAGAFQPDSSRVCLVCDAPFWKGFPAGGLHRTAPPRPGSGGTRIFRDGHPRTDDDADEEDQDDHAGGLLRACPVRRLERLQGRYRWRFVCRGSRRSLPLAFSPGRRLAGDLHRYDRALASARRPRDLPVGARLRPLPVRPDASDARSRGHARDFRVDLRNVQDLPRHAGKVSRHPVGADRRDHRRVFRVHPAHGALQSRDYPRLQYTRHTRFVRRGLVRHPHEHLRKFAHGVRISRGERLPLLRHSASGWNLHRDATHLGRAVHDARHPAVRPWGTGRRVFHRLRDR